MEETAAVLQTRSADFRDIEGERRWDGSFTAAIPRRGEVWEGVSLGVVGGKHTNVQFTPSCHGVQLREFAMPP